MRFTIEAKMLKDMLTFARPAACTRSTIPVLECVKLSVTSASLEITATDLEVGIIQTAECTTAERGDVLVGFKRLQDALKTMDAKKSARVDVALESDYLVVRQGAIVAKLPTMSVENYPELPTADSFAWTFDGPGFRNAIEATSAAISKEESRFTLNGALVDTAAGVMVATDGHRLHLAPAPCETYNAPLNSEKSAHLPILPMLALGILAKTKSASITMGAVHQVKAGAADYEKPPSYFVLQAHTPAVMTTIVARRLSGNFPDYVRVLPNAVESNWPSVEVSRVAMLAAVKAVTPAAVSANKGKPLVFLMIRNGRIEVLSGLQNGVLGTEESHSEVKAAAGGLADGMISLNPLYLADALTAAETETAVIRYLPNKKNARYGTVETCIDVRLGDVRLIISVRLMNGTTFGRIVNVEHITGYEAPTAETVAAVKEKNEKAPILNYDGPGFKHMTTAEWKAKYNDYKTTLEVGKGARKPRNYGNVRDDMRATLEVFEPHRIRIISAVGNGGWLPIFLTDTKVKAPGMAAAEPPAVVVEPEPEVYTCNACGRPEEECSADPCPSVVADRVAVVEPEPEQALEPDYKALVSSENLPESPAADPIQPAAEPKPAEPKKITLATVKAFIRKNRARLHVLVSSAFNIGNDDCVRPTGDTIPQPAQRPDRWDRETGQRIADGGDLEDRHNMGVVGVYFVNGSRDYFRPCDIPGWTGYEVYNCCGTFVVCVPAGAPEPPEPEKVKKPEAVSTPRQIEKFLAAADLNQPGYISDIKRNGFTVGKAGENGRADYDETAAMVERVEAALAAAGIDWTWTAYGWGGYGFYLNERAGQMRDAKRSNSLDQLGPASPYCESEPDPEPEPEPPADYKGPVSSQVFAETRAEKIARLKGEAARPVLAVDRSTELFVTPAAVGREMARRVLDELGADADASLSMLEPEAGTGALIEAASEEAAARACHVEVWAVERDRKLADYLRSTCTTPAIVHNADFLEFEPSQMPAVDFVLMNPPFSQYRDIKHIRHAFRFLKPGGVLAAVVGSPWESSPREVAAAFRDWINGPEVDMWEKIMELPSGTFHHTGAASRVLMIRKAGI